MFDVRSQRGEQYHCVLDDWLPHAVSCLPFVFAMGCVDDVGAVPCRRSGANSRDRARE